MRVAADSVDESRCAECRALAEGIHSLILRDLLPILEAEHRRAIGLAYRDYRRVEYSPMRAGIEGLAARLAQLEPRLIEPLSRETANELRHILYGLATLARVHVDRIGDDLGPSPASRN